MSYFLPRGRVRLRPFRETAIACFSGEVLEDRLLLSLEGNTLFPSDNPWNQSVASAPVAANSATLVASIGSSTKVHPDFGTIYQGAYIGIPYNVVSGSQPKVHVVVTEWPDQSDLLDVPIPPNAIIEGDPLDAADNDTDRHLLVYDKDNNVVYELYKVTRPEENADHQWHAFSEAVWNLDANTFRTPGDTSADAAGLPILPGLVRPDEVLDQGVINHALRFTVPRSRDEYVYPASHQAGDDNASYPRMGERFRLKASFDISGFSPANQVILRALKQYGMIVADNGSGWYISGEPSSRWDDDELNQLKSIAGSNFEAVDLTPIVNSLNQNTGSTAGGTPVTVQGLNLSGAAGQLQVRFGSTPATSVTILSDTQLVAIAPPHAAGTVHVSVITPYGTSATGSTDQFTFGGSSPAGSVVGRFLFYNQSKFDGNNAATGPSDDAAIATDKSAYRAGDGGATWASMSSYSRGINGVMIDLAGTHGTISAADVTFKIGASNSPGSWAAAPAPSSIVTRSGAGVSGADRIEIVWGANAPKNIWLQVTLKGNDATGSFDTNTGLAASDVFYFGNKIGEVGPGSATLAQTTVVDVNATRTNTGTLASITNAFDFDRSGTVTVTDVNLARTNSGNLAKISISAPAAAPLVELDDEADDNDATQTAVAVALVMRGTRAVGQGVAEVDAIGRAIAAIVDRFDELDGELAAEQLKQPTPTLLEKPE